MGGELDGNILHTKCKNGTWYLPLRTVIGSGIMETSKILLHEEITEQNPSKQLIILFVQRA